MKFAKLMMAAVMAAGSMFMVTGCGNKSFSVQEGESFIRKAFAEKNEEIADALHKSHICKENVELVSITPINPNNKNPTYRMYTVEYRTKHRAYKRGFDFCGGHGEYKDSFEVEKDQKNRKLYLTFTSIRPGVGASRYKIGLQENN